jgi:hypothetical protein
MDRVRIVRALRHRTRYRYVQPHIDSAEEGWIIKSPCCSRNVDPTGGVIDIAWLQPLQNAWALHHKDQLNQQWVLHAESRHLQPLLDELCLDPLRLFWP